MKRFAIVLLVLLSLTVYAALPTMVTAKLYVYECTETGAAFPADPPDTTAEVTYVSSLNPNPIRYSPKGVYSAVDGSITWYVPINSYLKVGCSAVIGMSTPANFAIATDNVVLNDMISSTPPSVTSINSFATIDCPSGTDPVADTAIDTLTLIAGSGISITGDSTADSVTIANTSSEADTLATVTARGASTNNTITVGSITPAVPSTSTLGDTTHPWSNLAVEGIDNLLRINQNAPTELVGMWGTLEINGRDTDYALHPLAGYGQDCAWFDTYDGAVLRGRLFARSTVGLEDTKPLVSMANTRSGVTAGVHSGAIYQGSWIDATKSTGNLLEFGAYTDTPYILTDYTFTVAHSGDLTTRGFVQTGSNGYDGQLKLYAEQGTTDYAVSLNPNASMTSAANFYLPADEPTGESFLKMGTDGVIDYDTATYLTTEVDGVVGNEVTDTNGTTLTRSGAGTSGDPYKLALNLGNANTWTVNQTAPYFVESSQYNADDPRPSGWPESSANALDDEFNSTGAPSNFVWHNISGTPAATQSGGFCKFTGATSGTFVKAVSDGDVTFAAKFSAPAYGSSIGLVVLDSNGTGYGAYLDYNGGSYYKIISVTITTWTTVSAGTSVNYNTQPYLGIRYYNDGGTRKVSIGISRDGKGWSTFWYGITTGVPATAAYIGYYVYNGYAAGDFMGSGAAQYSDWFRIQ